LREDRRGQDQEATVLRFSQCALKGQARRPDLEARLDGKLADKFATTLDPLAPTDLATGPQPVLEAVHSMVQESDRNYVVHVVSDFRAKDWTETAALEQAIKSLNTSGVEPNFITVVDQRRPNLSLVSLRVLPGARAENVPIGVELALANLGTEQVKNVPVAIIVDDKKPGFVEQFESIKPGETAFKKFEIGKLKAGQHTILAKVENPKPTEDTLPPDNQRQTTLEIEAAARILLIEGAKVDSTNKTAVDTHYLQMALDQKAAGLQTTTADPRILRDPKVKLTDFHAIFVANVRRLEESELKALEDYARAGGGVAFFMGDEVDPQYYTQRLYNKGAGIFPVPLVDTTILPPKKDDRPDLIFTPHEIFFDNVQDASAGRGGDVTTAFLQAVLVQRYLAVEKGWAPSAKSTAKIIAKLRNGAPLILESRFGDGRILTFLSAASPAMKNDDPATIWNNWGRGNPSFPTTIQQSQRFLSVWKQTDPIRLVGSPILWESPPVENLLEDVEIETPYSGVLATSKVKIDKAKNPWRLQYTDTNLAGLYFLGFTRPDGKKFTLRYPYNIDPREGDLATVSGQTLTERMPDAKFVFVSRDASAAASGDRDKNNISIWVLYLLIALLVGEQILAYSASYHLPSRTGGAP
ncbi:MAG: hypothetical protein SFX18_04290, partial [Pirellulales bacterium]|nr:hypothetical protein [Pirellulales bacterium]